MVARTVRSPPPRKANLLAPPRRASAWHGLVTGVSSAAPSGTLERPSGRKETEMRKLIVNEWMTLDGVVQAPAQPDEDTTSGTGNLLLTASGISASATPLSG